MAEVSDTHDGSDVDSPSATAATVTSSSTSPPSTSLPRRRRNIRNIVDPVTSNSSGPSASNSLEANLNDPESQRSHRVATRRGSAAPIPPSYFISTNSAGVRSRAMTTPTSSSAAPAPHTPHSETKAYKSHEMCTETVTDTHHVHKTWTIRNWSGIPQTEGYIVYDEEFQFVDHRWRLRLYPGGVTENVKGYISFYLDCRDATEEHPAYERHTFRVVNQLDPNNHWEQHSLPYKEHKDPDGWGWGKFLSHAQLKKEETGFRVQDTVIIELELYVYGEKKNTTVKALKAKNENVEEVVPVPDSTLSSDLCELFNSSNFSDVAFLVEGHKFPAHKAILSIRSPMLYAMFGNGMKESVATEVIVEDIERDIFKEVLRFIYSGFVSPNVLDTSPIHLLAAADKYHLCRLKAVCENRLFEQMTFMDCADVLVAADMHNANALKERCLAFMTESTERIRDVMETDSFKHLTETRPRLMVHIMQAMSDENILMTPGKKRVLELSAGGEGGRRKRRRGSGSNR